MKLDQVAYYCSNAGQIEEMKRMLGLQRKLWVLDKVTANISVRGRAPERSVGLLQFNYDLGIEVELLTYIEGSHWHMDNPLYGSLRVQEPFQSHIGFHLDPGEPWPTHPGQLVQEARTLSHTNPYLIEKRRTFEYRVHEVSPGSYVKFIRRIEH